MEKVTETAKNIKFFLFHEKQVEVTACLIYIYNYNNHDACLSNSNLSELIVTLLLVLIWSNLKKFLKGFRFLKKKKTKIVLSPSG